MSTGGFQRTVNRGMPIAVAGDFASANPRASVYAQEGALIAGLEGVTVGKFAWVDDDNRVVHSFGTAPRAPDGFVHREMQALIQSLTAEATMTITDGLPVTLFNKGDFYAMVEGATPATKGASVYANYLTGGITIGSAATGASATGSIGSTNTAALGSTNTAALGATFTATGTGTSFVVTAVTGLISIGEEIAGTGVTAGTTIDAQVSGTPGGAGTYTTSAATTSSGDTITSFGNVLVISSTTGYVSIGDTVNGSGGLPVGATLTALVTGTPGGAGTYTLSAPGTAYRASASGVTTFGDVVNITTVTGGIPYVGDTISGGAGFPVGATLTEQLSGTTGAAGRYRMSARGTAYTASAGSVTTFGTHVNVTVVASGTLGPGQPITGTGVPASAVLETQVSGTAGGVGVYTIDERASAYAASTALTTTGGVDTGWKCLAAAAVGEIVAISNPV